MKTVPMFIRSVQGCSESWPGGDQKGAVVRKRRGVDLRMETVWL